MRESYTAHTDVEKDLTLANGKTGSPAMVSAIVYAKLNSGQIGAESFPAAIK
jgi:hypothetical protein